MDFSGLMNDPQDAFDRKVLASEFVSAGSAAGAVSGRRVGAKAGAPASRGWVVSYGYTDPPQFAVSDPASIIIVAGTPDWVRQTIARSVATLNAEQLSGPAAFAAQHTRTATCVPQRPGRLGSVARPLTQRGENPARRAHPRTPGDRGLLGPDAGASPGAGPTVSTLSTSIG